MLEMNKIMFRPHLDMSRDIFGLSVKKTNMKAYTKLTDRRSVAQSRGNFCRRLQVKVQAGAAGGVVAAW